MQSFRPTSAQARFAAILLVVVLVLPAWLSATPSALAREGDRVGDWTEGAPDAPADAVAPAVPMPAGILVTQDGRELWSREADARRAMASTTKIMTAVVVLENTTPDDTVTVSASAGRIGESVAGLKSGEVLTVRVLLEAMLVKSGNDAAEALAIHVGGSEERFVEMMNETAEELGLTNSRFTNPHGLDQEGHYASARDLSVLARHAMANDEFRRVVGLTQVDLDGPGPAPRLETSNLLLGAYVGATGVKTGWTNRAGYCLVASAKRRDIELTAVVLGTGSEQARFDQAEVLLDWGFEHYTSQYVTSKDETVGAVPVADYLDVDVAAVVSDAVRVPVFDLDGDLVRDVRLDASVAAPVSRGDRIGTLSITQGDRLIAQVPVVAGADVKRPGLPERVWIAIVRGWQSVFGG